MQGRRVALEERRNQVALCKMRPGMFEATVKELTPAGSVYPTCLARSARFVLMEATGTTTVLKAMAPAAARNGKRLGRGGYIAFCVVPAECYREEIALKPEQYD
jgi:hypothetical protein